MDRLSHQRYWRGVHCVAMGHCRHRLHRHLYVMFSGARRLELRQNEVYGDNPEYQAYAKKTPILIPLLPIYSLAKYKWLRA